VNTTTDRIEKTIVLRAPREKVWAAIGDAKTFGKWFGMEFDAGFTAGARVTGKIVPTTVDATVASMQERYAGTPAEFFVERVEPPHVLSFRWHPFALDQSIDYSKEPMTLITFELEEVAEGTRVRVVESGFDSIPLARRADAFEANEEGWGLVITLLEKFLAA
jgi:uncharacterized protein YndB with AHSA1/START domain